MSYPHLEAEVEFRFRASDQVEVYSTDGPQRSSKSTFPSGILNILGAFVKLPFLVLLGELGCSPKPSVSE